MKNRDIFSRPSAYIVEPQLFPTEELNELFVLLQPVANSGRGVGLSLILIKNELISRSILPG